MDQFLLFEFFKSEHCTTEWKSMSLFQAASAPILILVKCLMSFAVRFLLVEFFKSEHFITEWKSVSLCFQKQALVFMKGLMMQAIEVI